MSRRHANWPRSFHHNILFTFELVINRHEYYDPKEVLRVLKPGHRFITQQVGGENEQSLNVLLGAAANHYAYWTLDYAVRELQEAGWRIIEQKVDSPIMRFYDVGAIVYYLKAIPWQIPDFTIEQYFNKLLEIHSQIEAQGYIGVLMHRFLILAEKS